MCVDLEEGGNSTGVVNERIDAPVCGLDGIESGVDGVVGFNVDLNCLDGGFCLNYFSFEGRNCIVGFLERSTAHQDSMRFRGGVKCFDSLVADSRIPACDEDDGGCCHFDGRLMNDSNFLCFCWVDLELHRLCKRVRCLYTRDNASYHAATPQQHVVPHSYRLQASVMGGDLCTLEPRGVGYA